MYQLGLFAHTCNKGYYGVVSIRSKNNLTVYVNGIKEFLIRFEGSEILQPPFKYE